MKRFVIFAACALALALSGCSSIKLTGDPTTDLANAGAALQTTSADIQNTQAAVAKFTEADLQAALADAQAHNDVPAVNCYEALVPIVHAQTQAGGAVQGAASAFQRTRDLVKLFKGSGSVAVGCAALYQDAKGDVLPLGGLFGLPLP